MNIQQILGLIQEDGAGWLFTMFIVMTGIQIAPIKVGPWSQVFNWIGEQITKPFKKSLTELKTSIDEVSTKLDKHLEEEERQKVDGVRKEIISLGSRIRRGEEVSDEELNRGAEKCDWYENYIENTGIKNGVATASIKAIRTRLEESYE